MGRPRKPEAGEISTRDRLYNRALELFAVKGFESVSVREITRSLGLNEATLYIHYKNKSALLEEILSRLESKVISRSFRHPDASEYATHPSAEIATSIIDGAAQFYAQADREVILIWRMLMISQYRYEPVRRVIEQHILTTPVQFFADIFTDLQKAGRISNSHNCRSLGRMIAALFFDYSFRSNLKTAWTDASEADFAVLAGDIRNLVGLIT